MNKVIVDIKGRLRQGAVPVSDGSGAFACRDVHELLPDLDALKERVVEQGAEIAELKSAIAELAKIIKEK